MASSSSRAFSLRPLRPYHRRIQISLEEPRRHNQPAPHSNNAATLRLSDGIRAPPAFSLPPFDVPAAMLHVNILWFLSLTLSVSCALAATLVQQWARKY
ncbi:hypothetical protein BC826DRAFT_1120037, partial [Russula brevipes]